MREYEFTFVVQPEITDEGIQAIQQRFEGILEKSGSEKLFYEDWGRRRLAYEIRSFQKGHYQVLHFLSAGDVVPEIERSARLDDSILRFLTVLVGEVRDLEARRVEGLGFEEDRVKRAAERAERDAEEAAEAAEAERSARAAAAEAAAAEAETETSEEDADESEGDESAEAPPEAGDADEGEEPTP